MLKSVKKLELYPVGDITEVYPDKAKLRAMVSIFGRETPVELEYKQIQKL